MHRLILIAFTVLIGALAARDAALTYWRVQDVDLVPKIFATDPILMVRRDEQLVSNPEQLVARAGAVASNASAALKAEPLDAMAMRQLGIVARVQQTGDGLLQFTVAERISRRDLAAQLLLIEQTARAGDVAAALSHYDRALLVYPAASQKLYPSLSMALSEPKIQSAMTLFSARGWYRDFLAHALDLGSDPAAVTALVLKARTHQPLRETERLTTGLIGQLVARGNYAAVRGLVGQMPGVLDDIAISAATGDAKLGILAWTLTNDGVFETVEGEHGALMIHVASERSGTIAQRIMLLAPGSYLFTQTVRYDADLPPATLQWEVRCLGDASTAPVWQQQMPVVFGQTIYRSEFSVPEGCGAQVWRLGATAQETQFASTARISDLTLVKQ